MKFFISLISAIIPINFCQSYQNTSPFIIIRSDQNIDLDKENWLTTYVHKDAIGQKKFCYSILQLQFFIYEGMDTEVYSRLNNIDQLLWRRKEFQMFTKSVTDDEKFPFLKCTLSYISVYLLQNSNYETYILFLGLSTFLIGVVTQSYTYQETTKEISEQIWQNLKTITSKNNLKQDSRLPLYSLNNFNQRKLCATIMNIPLPKFADMPPENKKFFILHSEFEENKFSNLYFSVESLTCVFQAYFSKTTIFYIAQLPNYENRIIVFGDNRTEVYDILEFEAGSSSSR